MLSTGECIVSDKLKVNNHYVGNITIGDEAFFGIPSKSTPEKYKEILSAYVPCICQIYINNTSNWLNVPEPGIMTICYGIATRAIYSHQSYSGNIYTGVVSDGVLQSWKSDIENLKALL